MTKEMASEGKPSSGTGQSAPGRLVSLDAFRGFDMMMIMGFAGVVKAIGKCIYGGKGGWLAEQMTHPEWFGLTFYDMIFPTFVFITGVTFPFSYAKQVERGMSSAQIHLRILRRAAVLIALGWVCNGIFSKGFVNLRYGSVLGKIGIAWMLAALAYVHFRRTARIVICAALVVGYAVLLNTVVAPDFPGASPLSVEGNFIGWLDRLTMPGVLYQGARIGGKWHASLCEPSGLYANFFSSATAMLGVFAGEIIRSERFSGGRKTLHLLALAAGLLVAGLAAIPVTPLCKKLWSPSFTLCVAAYSTAMFALFYWLADVKMWRRWTFFFVVIGVNAIAIYVLQWFVGFRSISKFFLGGLASLLPPTGGELLLACGYLAACWLTLYFLYRKKAFFKV